jgi:ribosomal protein S6
MLQPTMYNRAAMVRRTASMPTVDERVAYLEGRMEDHKGDVSTLRQDIRDLRKQIENLDQKVDRNFYSVDSKLSRYFIWLVGAQIGVLLAVVGALARR